MLLKILYRLLFAENEQDGSDWSNFLKAGQIETPAEGLECFAIFSYKDPCVRKIVRKIKYGGNKRYAKVAGRLLHEKILAIPFQNPVLVPTPLSPKRRRARGYNQAEMLARVAANDIFDIENDAVIKVKEVGSQTKLNKKARTENLRGAFRVTTAGKEKIRGRNIIIIDDIITTGATVSEIYKILVEAGVGKVVAVSFAH